MDRLGDQAGSSTAAAGALNPFGIADAPNPADSRFPPTKFEFPPGQAPPVLPDAVWRSAGEDYAALLEQMRRIQSEKEELLQVVRQARDTIREQSSMLQQAVATPSAPIPSVPTAAAPHMQIKNIKILKLLTHPPPPSFTFLLIGCWTPTPP